MRAQTLFYLFGGTTEDKVNSLRTLVFALLMEVEALRNVHIEAAHAAGDKPKDTLYGKSYYETALLTHNSAGPSSGLQKLIARYLGWQKQRGTWGGDNELRELVMLKELGFTDEEIEEYISRAENLETLT